MAIRVKTNGNGNGLLKPAINWRSRSSTFLLWLVAIAIVCLTLLYVAHLIGNYIGIRKDLERKSAIVVHPRVGDNEASDFGYIYSMRREKLIREGRLNLGWVVVVPATNDHYSCSYEAGYSDFKTGDSVRLIHTTSEDEGDYGYIIGLYDKESGKAASVWNFNLNSAEFYDP
jgi:hypothetical protein